MQFQQLGNTGVFVSRLCLGAMTFGGAGTIYETIGALPQTDTDKLIGFALDAGVNFFDTANVRMTWVSRDCISCSRPKPV